MSVPPAVVLLSGGLDSVTTLAVARAKGFAPYALTFRYGQRHQFEIVAAEHSAKYLRVAEHVVMDINLGQFGGSALTTDLDIPKHENPTDIDDGIPSTYVPARNTILLSIALGWAEVLSSSDIFIGVNAVDYSGYPDCRPEYIAAFEQMANLATRAGVEGDRPITIHTPLIDLTKAQIIKRGLELGVDYGLTHTCYDPNQDGSPCQQCDACHLRARGFAEAEVADPLLLGKAESDA
jgi:7-cyano-7-deazaguanine synthase